MVYDVHYNETALRKVMLENADKKVFLCDSSKLGTGLVLLPWAVVAAIMSNFPIAIGLMVLYIIMMVVRNTVEPKLVGQQIGLHPLATLISMFLGMQLFGIIGLFVFPVVLSLLVQFERDGVLPHPSWMTK